MLAAHGFTLDAESGRDRASSRRTSGRSAPGPRRSAATSTATRPSGGASTPARSRGRGCVRRGTGGRGPRPGRTRSSPPTALSWSRGGTTSCASWATATRHGARPLARGDAVGLDRPGRGGRTGSISQLGAKRSAWNAADIRGKVEVLLAQASLVAEPAARIELAEDITARAAGRCVRLLDRSRRARARPVADLAAGARGRGATSSPGSRARAEQPARRSALSGRGLVRVDPTQAAVVGALAGDGQLVVVEGAAGAGKTTTLRRPRHCWPGRAIGWWW